MASEQHKHANAWSTSEIILAAFVAVGLAYSAAILGLSWREPLLDDHGFRQTQTALTVQWLLRGSPWIAYQTPVIGYPWTIPFEFPLFQGIVALVAQTGLSLDQAGRLTSWIFFVVGVIVAARILLRLGAGRSLVLIFSAVWLFSPLYDFWARSFMIESFACTLSLAFLLCLVEYEQGALGAARAPRLVFTAGAMLLFAVLAALVKITAFFGFGLAGAGISLWMMWRGWRERASVQRAILIGAGPAVAVTVSLICTVAWLRYTDQLKLSNSLASVLTSSNLGDWGFGPKLLLDPKTWATLLERRDFVAIWGSPLQIAVVTLYAILRRAGRAVILSGVFLYIAPLVVFSNLHLVHDYYQYENGVFAVLAASGAVWAFGASVRPGQLPITLPLVLVVIAVQVFDFTNQYLPLIQQASDNRMTPIAQFVKQETRPDDVVVIAGVGWSSEIPYYSDRRGLALPDWSAPQLAKLPSGELRQWTGGLRVGAIVDCPNWDGDTNVHRWLAPAEAVRKRYAVATCQIFI